MQAEIFALRHQVIVSQRTQKTKRPDLHRADRWLWVWLSQLWSGWRSALIIVKPQTVLNWHRKGFRWYWTWKIRHRQTGRPRIASETRDLIRTMSRMNVLWGADQETEHSDHGAWLHAQFSISTASRATTND